MGILSAKDIKRLFDLLNKELAQSGVIGELYLVGGAVMCLVFDARPATRDVDAIFEPSKKIREAAVRVAESSGQPIDWLNDGVKGFLSDKATFDDYLELSHLKIFTADAKYLLAMKSLSMRIGAEFHDVDDVRYLLRFLNIASYEQALEIITSYYPMERFPPKTLYALEEILS